MIIFLNKLIQYALQLTSRIFIIYEYSNLTKYTYKSIPKDIKM